jgi:small-conductance mechanosensitive channel
VIDVQTILAAAVDLIPTVVVVFLGGAGLVAANRWIRRRAERVPGAGAFRRELLMVGLGLVFLIALVLVLPVTEATRGSLITLFSLGITAVIALSSTTLASNAMAGLMLRVVRNFRRGDYIRVGKFLGRVTERGLFHIEVQNERSDLVTLPNLYVASNVVTVIRPSGTFISASLSLGYDIHHDEISKLLIQAAESAGLVEAFVRIRSLGDFSVTYEVSGQLGDTKRFLGSKSSLHRAVLDTLHQNGVEIVSPNFMNQRQLADRKAFIPEMDVDQPATTSEPERTPDTVVFDKADRAERADDLRNRLATLDEEIAALNATLKDASEEDAVRTKKTIETRMQIRDRVANRIKEMETEIED